MFWLGKNKEKSSSNAIYNENIDKMNMPLNTESIKKCIQHSGDIVFRQLYINSNKDLPVTMVFVDGLVNSKSVDDDILKPLTQEMQLSNLKNIQEVIDLIEHGTIYHISQKTRNTLKDCIEDIMDGSVALIFEQVNKALTFDIKGYEKRSITESSSENVVKGSKDSFIEDFRVNTTMIRRKLKTHNLVIEEMKVGKQSKTRIGIVYIKGITNENIKNEIKRRLEKIDVDSAITSGIIEENIIDNKYSPFPQVFYTERPDKLCSNILEGRIGIIIENLPITLIMPSLLVQFFQAPEDYSEHFIISSTLRFLRYTLALVTLFFPAFYISITTFHHEMIPTDLALSIQSAKEGVPFPTFVEVIFMLIAFEVLIEAGLRLPQNIGQAVSIVGAIVVGQAATEAKLVSPAVVVVIAITAISSFTMANQDFSNAIRLWRFIFVILTSIIGLYGLSISAIILLFHLSKLEVLGIPYLSPYVEGEGKQLQDTLFRMPFSTLYKRPIDLKTVNKKRRD